MNVADVAATFNVADVAFGIKGRLDLDEPPFLVVCTEILVGHKKNYLKCYLKALHSMHEWDHYIVTRILIIYLCFCLFISEEKWQMLC